MKNTLATGAGHAFVLNLTALMKAPYESSGIAKALLSELKAVREKHQEFQTRVKAADQAARARDEDVRRQNLILTKKIGQLESELRQARESVEILRQFTELLPTVRGELDSFEDNVKAFEVVGDDTSGHQDAAAASTRVRSLDKRINQISKLCNLSETELSDLGFSLVDGSTMCIPLGTSSAPKPDPGPNSVPYPKPASKPNPGPPVHPKPAPPNPAPKPNCAAKSSGSSLLRTEPASVSDKKLIPTQVLKPAPVAISPLNHPKPPPASSQPNDLQTNRARAEIILNLRNEPYALGKLWFIIPQPWLEGWMRICLDHPDDIKSEVSKINISSIKKASGYTSVGRVSIPGPAWLQFLEWYGSDGEAIPSVVMPRSPGESPFADLSPRFIQLYFMLPPSIPWSSVIDGPYTPQVIIPSKCSIKLLRSIILNSLSPHPGNRSIEFFSLPSVFGEGWYVPHRSGLQIVLPESQAEKQVDIDSGSAVIVSVQVFDEATRSMVPINPFRYPAIPPKYLTWSASCA